MQTFTAPLAANYRIQCWGASGGGASVGTGGSGGYTSGIISLNKKRVLYIYIGQRGKRYEDYSSTYMFNGGGFANKTDTHCGSCGGGATDIRTINGNWDNSTSLNSRIIIAAGGGGFGGSSPIDKFPSCAGGLIGYDGCSNDNYPNCQGKGATQTNGGSQPTQVYSTAQNGTAGTLGKGGIGGHSISTTPTGGGSGGGGGLYGGSGSGGLAHGTWDGGGGSSYISGHPGCTAQTLIFTNTVMIDGAGYQWTSTKGAQVGIPTTANQSIRENGYVGNGYSIISWISPSL